MVTTARVVQLTVRSGPLLHEQLNTLLGSGVFNSDGRFFFCCGGCVRENERRLIWLGCAGDMWKYVSREPAGRLKARLRCALGSTGP